MWNGPCDLLLRRGKRKRAAGGRSVKRTAAALILTGAAWMGLSGEARAQVLITPTGPLALSRAPEAYSAMESNLARDDDKFYPGRTMGGGTRVLRTNPPP